MALVAIRLRGVRVTIVPAVLVIAAFLVLLVTPRGAAHQAVPLNAHRSNPINGRPFVVTDAQHAALVVHSGHRPLVLQAAIGN